jgi:predicted cupin superfamily sugar epimerase
VIRAGPGAGPISLSVSHPGESNGRNGQDGRTHPQVRAADQGVPTIWHFYAGEPVRMRLHSGVEGDDLSHVVLGPGLAAGEVPQVVVPERWWQTAVPLGAWALVGCTVSPAFEFDGVELAPADWEPLGREPPGGEAPSREAPG